MKSFFNRESVYLGLYTSPSQNLPNLISQFLATFSWCLPHTSSLVWHPITHKLKSKIIEYRKNTLACACKNTSTIFGSEVRLDLQAVYEYLTDIMNIIQAAWEICYIGFSFCNAI